MSLTDHNYRIYLWYIYTLSRQHSYTILILQSSKPYRLAFILPKHKTSKPMTEQAISVYHDQDFGGIFEKFL